MIDADGQSRAHRTTRFSNASVSALFAADLRALRPFPRFCPFCCARSRAIASTWRTLRSRATISSASASAFGVADEHARMPGAELAAVNIGLDRIGELQQAQRVGDVAAALADDLGDLFLAVAELVDQRAIAFRLLERIEVGALHVLDDRELQSFRIGRFDDDDRHLVQPARCAARQRRSPAMIS